jgi:hypothetical protein
LNAGLLDGEFVTEDVEDRPSSSHDSFDICFISARTTTNLKAVPCKFSRFSFYVSDVNSNLRGQAGNATTTEKKASNLSAVYERFHYVNRQAA